MVSDSGSVGATDNSLDRGKFETPQLCLSGQLDDLTYVGADDGHEADESGKQVRDWFGGHLGYLGHLGHVSSKGRRDGPNGRDGRQSTRWGRFKQEVDENLIQGFVPAYFVSIMGTGISSGILYKFPFPARWLEICGYVMFGVAILFFLGSCILCLISLYRYPRKVSQFLWDPTLAPFMGCLPMGYITLVNFLYFLIGESWISGIWTLWWLSVVASFYAAFVVFYFAFMAKRAKADNNLDTEDLHATLLLPVVTLTVAASSGNLFALDLPTVSHQVLTMTLCYVMWCIAIFLASIIITVYFWKLFVHKIPPATLVFTSFLPVGVLGQGAFGILLFGDNVFQITVKHYKTITTSEYLQFLHPITLDSTHLLSYSSLLGQIVLFTCTMVSLFLISFGFFCTYVAVISCLSKIPPFTKNYSLALAYNSSSSNVFKRQFNGLIRFNKAYWAMTFPLGTMALANHQFSLMFGGFLAFKIIATIYGVACITITIGCVGGFLYHLGHSIVYIIKGNPSQDTLTSQLSV